MINYTELRERIWTLCKYLGIGMQESKLCDDVYLSTEIPGVGDLVEPHHFEAAIQYLELEKQRYDEAVAEGLFDDQIREFDNMKTVEVPDMDLIVFEKHFGVDLTEFRTKEGG